MISFLFFSSAIAVVVAYTGTTQYCLPIVSHRLLGERAHGMYPFLGNYWLLDAGEERIGFNCLPSVMA